MSPSIIDRALGLIGLARKPDVRAGHDLAKWTHENKRHWTDADAMSGRTAYPRADRKLARERSRHETANNSWLAGMIRTARNHIVGTGPRLQVLTVDSALNARIERAWKRWANAIGLTEKLGIAVETYWRDGEWFCMRANNSRLYPISLDIRAYEADQVSQPYWSMLDPSIEDGKRIDNLGNAIEYWIYDHHPGDIGIGVLDPLAGQWYPADDVIHLYRADRPGQLRGFPRCAPAIDWLAHMRRFSKATLSTAEQIALNFGMFCKTTSSQIVQKRLSADFMPVEVERGALNFIPEGWEPSSLASAHPAQSNAEFQRTELTYFARCCNMPYSLAAGTSRDSNFASAKMDIKNTWEPEVWSEQEKLSRDVLAPIFRWFLEEAVFAPGILDGAPTIDEIDYQFFWPPLPQSDEMDQANAAARRMETGQSTLPMEYMRQGEDAEAALQTGAKFYGVSVAEFQKALFSKIFATASGAVAGVAPQQPAAAPKTPDVNELTPAEAVA